MKRLLVKDGHEFPPSDPRPDGQAGPTFTAYFTKADVMKILAELEGAVEKNQIAQVEHGLSDIREGKIRAYRYAISRIKSMAQWKGIEL